MYGYLVDDSEQLFDIIVAHMNNFLISISKMLKLPKDPLSTIVTSKNNVKTALLNSVAGLSVIGSVFNFGAEDSEISGQTFLTLQAKLLDSIGSPENMFRHGISPQLLIQRDKSTVLLSFIPGSEKVANSVLDVFFSNSAPSTHSLGQARRILSEQEKVGNISPSELFECAACAASYNDPHHHVDIYNNEPSSLVANSKILENLKSSAILFGTNDQEKNLVSLASTLEPRKEKVIKPSQFQPGTFTKKPSKIDFKGNVLQKNRSMELAVISFPAASASSDDFFTYKVIQKIFGGASEFSSEGLGVGLNSLLYINSSAFGCEFNYCHYFPYAQNGLISFGFKAEADSFATVARKIATCVKKSFDVKNDLIESAKEQAIVEILKGVDDVKDRFFEFAAQNYMWGEAKQVSSIVEAIRAVPREKILKCLEQTFANSPSIGIIGEAQPQIIQKSWQLNIK